MNAYLKILTQMEFSRNGVSAGIKPKTRQSRGKMQVKVGSHHRIYPAIISLSSEGIARNCSCFPACYLSLATVLEERRPVDDHGDGRWRFLPLRNNAKEALTVRSDDAAVS